MRAATVTLLAALALESACAAPAPTSSLSDSHPALAASNGLSSRLRTPGLKKAVTFLPAEYECELFVDYAALREIGVLDQLERIPGVSDILRAIGEGYCCDLEQIERTRTAMVFDWSSQRPGNRQVSIAEGRDLRAPVTAC